MFIRNADKGSVRPHVVFRSKWNKDWTDTAPIGEIWAKAVDPNGDNVTPIKFVNVGAQLSISINSIKEDLCDVKVNWPHGKVVPMVGRMISDGKWEIGKDDCEDPNNIPFKFVPNDNPNNEFTLHVKSPFKDFGIEDGEGNPIAYEALIPFADIEAYRYHIAGLNIDEYSVGSRKFCLYRTENGLMRKERLNNDGTPEKKIIPSEGSLINLLGSRESLQMMFDRSSDSIIEGVIPVEICFNDHKLKFFIKQYAYKIFQDGTKLTVQENQYREVKDAGSLIIYRLNAPDLEGVALKRDEDGYFLKEEMQTWGPLIITGRARGRIRPKLIEFEKNPDDDERRANRQSEIWLKDQEIENAKFDDDVWRRVIGWFNHTIKDDLPCSSFLDLVSLGNNPKSLVKMTFQLFLQAEDEEELENLKLNLGKLSKDLSFQWFWIVSLLNKGLSYIQNILESFFDYDQRTSLIIKSSPIIKKLVVKKAIAENDFSTLQALNNLKICTDKWIDIFIIKLPEFYRWLKDLCKQSLHECYVSQDRKYTEVIIGRMESFISDGKKEKLVINDMDDCIATDNQQHLKDVKLFFERYKNPNLSANEEWLHRRVMCIADHITGRNDLYEALQDHVTMIQSNENLHNEIDDLSDEELREIKGLSEEELKGRVRRSIIYCYMSNRDKYLYELNKAL